MIAEDVGEAALAEVRAAAASSVGFAALTASRLAQLTAVRYLLGILERQYPGRSVELRVPPAGAIQVLSGTTHRRGTPPAVVEMDMPAFLALAFGDSDWTSGIYSGTIRASGERSDLSELFPVRRAGH